jgi:hypothetical protein
MTNDKLGKFSNEEFSKALQATTSTLCVGNFPQYIEKKNYTSR